MVEYSEDGTFVLCGGTLYTKVINLQSTILNLNICTNTRCYYFVYNFVNAILVCRF